MISQSFNLRSTVRARPAGTAGAPRSISVTAILEKANSIRQVSRNFCSVLSLVFHVFCYLHMLGRIIYYRVTYQAVACDSEDDDDDDNWSDV